MRMALLIGTLVTHLMTPLAIGADRATDLAEVVAAERSFAARAQVVNARLAFAEYFAPDAVLFAPFPAPAFPRLRDSPDWTVNIQWRPVAAAVSGAGDMGYTTGPSEYRRSPTDAPVGFGHYTSVWQRQPDGRFLVRIDIGIDHPEPAVRVPDWSPPATPPSGRARARPGRAQRRSARTAGDRRPPRRLLARGCAARAVSCAGR